MSASFGSWPPVGKQASPPGQAAMRLRAAIGIASDGTIGVDACKVVTSVTHVGASGTYLINLNIALTALTTVNGSLLGAAGEIDVTPGGATVLVHTRDSAGVLTDKSFYVNVFG